MKNQRVFSLNPIAFNGNGTFVSWQGFSMKRDFKGNSDPLKNNKLPAHVFTYRPDFLINAPEGFKRSGIEWQEVAPGN